ncbi:hypothetical protein D3C76_938150 [compost metagenome]
MLAWQLRGNAKAGDPRPPILAVDEDMCGLEVLMDEAALMELAQRRRDANCETQDPVHFHWRGEHQFERLTARILKH